MTPLCWLTAPHAAILCANPNDLQVCSRLKMFRDRCQSGCVHNFHLCIEFSLVSNNCNSRLSFRATVDGSPLSDLRDSSGDVARRQQGFRHVLWSTVRRGSASRSLCWSATRTKWAFGAAQQLRGSWGCCGRRFASDQTVR